MSSNFAIILGRNILQSYGVLRKRRQSPNYTAAVFGAVAEFGDKLSPFVAIVASVDRALTVQRWSSYAN